MTSYSFDVDLAKQFGVNEAIFLNNIQHWITKNKANGKNQYEGETWTFNTLNAWTELFPWLSRDQVRTIIKKLKSAGVLKTAQFDGENRQLYYRIDSKALAEFHVGNQPPILVKGGGENPTSGGENPTCLITDVKPDLKQPKARAREEEEEVKSETPNDIPPDLHPATFEIVEQAYAAVGVAIPKPENKKRGNYLSHLSGISGMLADHDPEKLVWIIRRAVADREIVKTFDSCTLGRLPMVMEKYGKAWSEELRERGRRAENDRLKAARENEIKVPEEVWRENMAKLKTLMKGAAS